MSFESIKKEFNSFSNWEDKYKLIIEKGRGLHPLPTGLNLEDYKVKGCQSQVWLYPTFERGIVKFYGDSDATLVRGIVAILLELYSNKTPREILSIDAGCLAEIGITDHLSMSRSNGLASMVKQIKMYAYAYSHMEAS